MFINFSNHSSAQWSEEQHSAASAFGEVVDYQFPDVDPTWSEEEVSRLAEKCAKEILEQSPDYVLCQGEFCLAFAVAEKLKARKIRVGSACSRREAVESVDENGDHIKRSIFRFVQFREYQN